MKVLRHLIVLSLLTHSLSAAEAPGWSRGQQLLPLRFEECVRRASQALSNDGYRVDHAAVAFAVGVKDVHTAVIMCNAGPDSKQWVNIVVASNGEGGGGERERLQAQMQQPTPPAGGGQPPRAGRYLSVSMMGRQAKVTWTNAPTTEGAWVSIVPAGTADGVHVGRWTYTNRKSSGTFENGPLDPGAYEARFYGDGGYDLIFDRVRFSVGQDSTPGQSGNILDVRVQARTAIVTWRNAPTPDGAWVSIVPAGTADGTHVGRWIYTDRTSSGTFENGPLDPGNYEARFYGDAYYGKLIERIRFVVP